MKTLRYCLFIVAACSLMGCADMTELNQNPTKATSISSQLLIPTIELAHSQNYQNVLRYMIYPGAFCNQWIGGWSMQEYGGKGKKNTAYMERLWTVFYPDIIKNAVQLVHQSAGKPDEVNMHAIGRILKVEAFLKLTDYYGDIPYTEAASIYFDNKVKPRYDKQEDIYMDFLKELREASAELNPAASVPSSDLYFKGDVNKWRKFANSLWLRIAMRLIKVNPELAQSEAKAAIEAGLMESNDDIAYVKHEDSRQLEGPGNGYANEFIENRQYSDFRMTTELLDALDGDPRVRFIGGSYFTDKDRTDITDIVYQKNGKYLGAPAQTFIYNSWAPTIQVTIDGKNYSVTHQYQKMQPSKLLTAADAPYIHLSYAETEFYRAEALVRGWNIVSSTAQEHYRKGLVAAIKQWSLFGATLPPDAEIEAFAEKQSQIVASGGTAALEEIEKQMWILYIIDPIEAWSNIRRTEMPSKYVMFKNVAAKENQSNGMRPRRMQYPLEEQKKNAASWQEAVDRMGGTDDWTNPVWWDVQK